MDPDTRPLTPGRPDSPRGIYKGSQVYDVRTYTQIAYDCMTERLVLFGNRTGRLYRKAYIKAEPYLPFLNALLLGVELLFRPIAYTIWHPMKAAEVVQNFRLEEKTRRRALWSLRRMLRVALLEMFKWLGYHSAVSYKFLFSRWSPQQRSEWVAAGKRRRAAYPIPLRGMVRIKWYPDLQAARVWPEELGELWVDLPLDPENNLDLSPLKRLWGMENCYVIDTTGRRLTLGRRPDEKLSPLAWNVLLNGHDVLGVVECPTPTMQAARRGRAAVKQALVVDPKRTVETIAREGLPLVGRGAAALFDTVLWMAITFLAIITFASWRVSVFFAHIAQYFTCKLLAFICEVYASVVAPYAWWCYRWTATQLAWMKRAMSTWARVAWSVGSSWLMWLGRGVWAWTVTFLELTLLSREEVAMLEHAREKAREWDTFSEDSEYSD